MEQYINKAALVAEIERRLEAIASSSNENNRELAAIIGAQQYELINLALFLNTLEVKEVDLEKEFDDYIEKQNAFTNNDNSEIKYYNGDSFNHDYDVYPIAKHFYELGIKAQKGK